MTDDVARFLDDIDALLEDERYDWASKTLQGIRATVKHFGHVTDGQRQAVGNICSGVRAAGLPSDKYRSSRRYEGWIPPR